MFYKKYTKETGFFEAGFVFIGRFFAIYSYSDPLNLFGIDINIGYNGIHIGLSIANRLYGIELFSNN